MISVSEAIFGLDITYYMSGGEIASMKSPLRGSRIQVVGHAGVGKSTFAVELGKILQVPVIHLDPIFWSQDWVPTPTEMAQKVIRQHADQEAWIIDGNQWVPLKDITYLQATDIIWIDPPFYVWLYRLLSRAIYKSFTIRGSFYRDFLNSRTSIIVQAFRLRKKKMRNWNQMMSKDNRWQRVSNTKKFLDSLRQFRDRE